MAKLNLFFYISTLGVGKVDTAIINFMAPPIPYFIGCGIENYSIGEKHIHRYNTGVFDIIVVVKGKLSIGEEHKQWEIGESEALILRPDLYHYGVSDCTADTIIHWIHFHTSAVWAEHESMQEYLQNLLQLKDQYEAMPNHLINPISIPKHSCLTERALAYVKELIQLADEPKAIASWKQQTVFQQLLQYLDLEQSLQQDITAIKIAEHVAQFLKENYQLQLSNELLQQQFNFHPNYLARCMRKHYGVTPLEYLNKLRLDKAKKLLLNTDYSIETVAEQIGMELSTFSNSFKHKEGVSPSQYRKKYIKLY